MVHEFDLEVEREIAKNTAVSVSYVGSLGRRLPHFVDGNLAAPTLTTTYTVVGGPFDGQQFTVPFFGVPNTLTGTRRPNNTVQAVTSDLQFGELQLQCDGGSFESPHLPELPNPVFVHLVPCQ